MPDTTRSREQNTQSQSIMSIKVGKWKISGTVRELHSVIPHITAFGRNSNPSLNPLLSIKDTSKDTALDSAARFISFLVETKASDGILVTVFRSLERDFLQDTDPHSLALQLDPVLRPPFLKAFCQSFRNLSHLPKSALLKAAQDGTASLYAIFGGQGNANYTCLQELRILHNIYGGFLEQLFDIAASILSELALTTGAVDFEYDYKGFNLRRWLVRPEDAPDQVHIAAAPISFPLIGLVSLAHYCIACKVLGGSPGDLGTALSGVTGHSQGIIIAAVVAQSTTWESFYGAAETGLKLLFWIGLESHYATPAVILPTEDGENPQPSPMLSIRGLDQGSLLLSMNEVNLCFEEREKIHLALINSPNNMVVAGPPKTLLGLHKLLERIAAPKQLDQSKIPYPRRQPVFDFSFLPISAPFHSPHLQDATLRVLQHLESESILRSSLLIPVHGTSNGIDLRSNTADNLVEPLVRMIMTETVNWAAACLPHKYTHLLDFGPARSSTFLKEFTEGSGTRTINIFDIAGSSRDLGCKSELFAPALPPKSSNWEDENGPSLLQKPDGEVELSTKMTRLLGTPPIMVAGMTPTTVPWDFVSAVTNAGYHVELAAGGYVDPQSFEQAIRKIAASIPIHRGITCNLIYVNPKSMAWQIPLIKRLIASGVRIEGLTVGAGVPSLDVATNYIETIGVKHISFKPSSISSIQHVLSIAESNPLFPICIQWTGGRAGGHHSYEDLHQPILKTYDQIRKHTNVVLIAGGGFGDASEAAGYLTGSWSRSFGYSAMPFDGILLGSRMMVAQEAHTSQKVKDLILQTQGCDDSRWHKSYEGAVGGVVTVSSEMGQPIHKIANRAVLLWKDLDDRIFNIENPEKRLKALQISRQEIITRLNSDYAKPWFAVDSSGINVEIEDLTYSECLHRLVKLMYVQSEKRWVDESYKKRVLAFVNRFRERFLSTSGFELSENWDPALHLDEFLSCHANASRELLYQEDVSYFIALCKTRGEKPVNFIPRLDENFETWFKKDSLWQMEDIEAVVDQDPQRVCIIHGPVAIQYSTKADEPVASILDEITSKLVEKLRPMLQNKPFIGMVSPPIHSSPKLRNTFIQTTTTRSEYQFAEHDLPLPEYETIISHMLRSHRGWAQACLLDQYIRCGGRVTKNPIAAAFRPRHGDSIVVTYDHDSEVEYIGLHTKGLDNSTYSPISLKCNGEGRVEVSMRTTQARTFVNGSIVFEFDFVPQDKEHRLHEVMEHHDKRIKGLYADLWSHERSLCYDFEAGAEHQGGSTTLSYKMVEAFMTVVTRSDVGQPSRESPSSQAIPLDICIVICWTALTRPLVTSGIGGDLLRLLHRSNSFQYYDGARPLSVGDTLETSSRVMAVSLQPAGKSITVVATIKREKKPVVSVTSVFLIQGKFEDEENLFQLIDHPEVLLPVASLKLQALLRSRSWITFIHSTESLIGTTLQINLHTEQRPGSLGNDLKIKGTIFQVSDKQISRSVGTIDFTHPSYLGNPVLEFFERHGGTIYKAKALRNPGWRKSSVWQVKIPSSSTAYSRISQDTNPIHTCPTFARYAGLPGTVAHGMYTSAAVRRVVERVVANADCSRFRAWSCSFDGIVVQGDLLDIEIQHVAMSHGRMVISVRVYNSVTRDKVLEAEAEVEQASTAYLFCGQGSQEKEMGLALYKSNSAARMIWDQGDKYFLDTYGFSLLDIVTKDPKTLTIHFGGKRGRKIRDNYLAMTRKTIRNGKEIIEPILPGLMLASQSYSFAEERGLLFSTQFAQPALTLMEIAEFEALKSHDVVQQNSKFAGHSLGEYAALASCTSFMSLENLLDLVFYRGLSMQIAMTRDRDGRTEFSMVAVNPSRISRVLKEDFFKEIIQGIADESGLLLEIVNWNVEGQQYVCAGHLQALAVLISTTNALSSLKSSSYTSSVLKPLIAHHLSASKSLVRPIELQRGVATTPLNGIDIPFHSTHLRGGIDTYREYLKEKVKESDLVPEELVGKWIPNLVGVPFGTGREFVEKVAGLSGSQILKGMLEGVLV